MLLDYLSGALDVDADQMRRARSIPIGKARTQRPA